MNDSPRFVLSPANVAGPKRSRRRPLIAVSFCILIAVCLAGRMVFVQLSERLGEAKPGAAYLHELDVNRAAGLPVTPADLNRPPVPESTNSAPLYLQLVDILKKKPLSKQDEDKVVRLSVRGQISNEELEAGRQVIADRSDISDIVHRAVIRPDCHFERDYSPGPALLFPEFAKMRTAARWIAGEASILARDGKPKEAIKHAALGFNIGRQLSHDPTLIGYLVSLATDTLTLGALQTVLYLAPNQPGVPVQIRKAISAGWKANSLSHTLQGELVMTAVILDNFRKYGPSYGKALAGERDTSDDLSTHVGQAAVNWPAFLDNNGILMLKSLRELIAIADQPYPESHVHSEFLANAVQNNGTQAILANILYPVYDGVIDKRAIGFGKVRVVAAAADIVAYHKKYGHFPETLKDVTNPIPIDPFNQEPLRYRHEGNGFVIYSIGSTGQFDGHAKDKKQYNAEAVFVYPAPEFLGEPAR